MRYPRIELGLRVPWFWLDGKVSVYAFCIASVSFDVSRPCGKRMRHAQRNATSVHGICHGPRCAGALGSRGKMIDMFG